MRSWMYKPMLRGCISQWSNRIGAGNIFSLMRIVAKNNAKQSFETKDIIIPLGHQWWRCDTLGSFLESSIPREAIGFLQL